MKGTKPREKATITLCLSFPNKANKHQQEYPMFPNKATLKDGGDFALEITKQPKNFFWPIEIKKLNEYYG